MSIKVLTTLCVDLLLCIILGLIEGEGTVTTEVYRSENRSEERMGKS